MFMAIVAFNKKNVIYFIQAQKNTIFFASSTNEKNIFIFPYGKIKY